MLLGVYLMGSRFSENYITFHWIASATSHCCRKQAIKLPTLQVLTSIITQTSRRRMKLQTLNIRVRELHSTDSKECKCQHRLLLLLHYCRCSHAYSTSSHSVCSTLLEDGVVLSLISQ